MADRVGVPNNKYYSKLLQYELSNTNAIDNSVEICFEFTSVTSRSSSVEHYNVDHLQPVKVMVKRQTDNSSACT